MRSAPGDDTPEQERAGGEDAEGQVVVDRQQDQAEQAQERPVRESLQGAEAPDRQDDRLPGLMPARNEPGQVGCCEECGDEPGRDQPSGIAPAALEREQRQPGSGRRDRAQAHPDRQARAGREGDARHRDRDARCAPGAVRRLREDQKPEPGRKGGGDVVRDPDQGARPIQDLVVQPFRHRDPEPGGDPVAEDQQDVEPGRRQQQEGRTAYEARGGLPHQAGGGEQPVQQAEQPDPGPEREPREGGAPVHVRSAGPVDQGAQRVEEVIVAGALGPGEERIDRRQAVLDDRAGQACVLHEVDDGDGLVQARAGIDVDQRVTDDPEPEPGERQAVRRGGEIDPAPQRADRRHQPGQPQREVGQRGGRDAGGLDQQAVENRQQADAQQSRAQEPIAGREGAEAEDPGQSAQRVARQQQQGDTEQRRRQDPARVRETGVHRRAALRRAFPPQPRPGSRDEAVSV
ncbi:hypothetical protein [Methylobacterium sp. WL1]|uniref:hypothetical protein n=1 Tax=Methylobacterium sp. WL1 TaxID=2603276 RepID=UPI001FEF30FE|nr:hypothetical protein [Methylobacterium sp. WL1]